MLSTIPSVYICRQYLTNLHLISIRNCTFLTFLYFRNPSWFIIVTNLMGANQFFLILVCLLQALCRHHRQYRHHQVCPLHQGNWVLNNCGFCGKQTKTKWKCSSAYNDFWIVSPHFSRDQGLINPWYLYVSNMLLISTYNNNLRFL